MSDMYIVSYRTGGSCHSFIITLILSLYMEEDYRIWFDHDKANAHSILSNYIKNHLKYDGKKDHNLSQLLNGGSVLANSIENITVDDDIPLIVQIGYNPQLIRKIYDVCKNRYNKIVHIVIRYTEKEQFEVHANHFFKNARYYEPHIMPYEQYWSSYYDCFEKGLITRVINNLKDLSKNEAYILLNNVVKMDCVPFTFEVPSDIDMIRYDLNYHDIINHSTIILKTLEKATEKTSTRTIRNLYTYYLELQKIFRKKWFPDHLQLP